MTRFESFQEKFSALPKMTNLDTLFYGHLIYFFLMILNDIMRYLSFLMVLDDIMRDFLYTQV